MLVPLTVYVCMSSFLISTVCYYLYRHEVAPGYPDDSVNYSSQYSWSFGVLFNMLVSGV